MSGTVILDAGLPKSSVEQNSVDAGRYRLRQSVTSMSEIRKVIVISGLVNSGKTTVSKLLVEMLPKTVRIELDEIGRIVKEVMPVSERGMIVIEDTVSLAINWIDRGYDVILLGPFWKVVFEQLTTEMTIHLATRRVNYHAFILTPPLDVTLQQRGLRVPEDYVPRLNREFHEQGLDNPGFGIKIDNQSQTPDETATLIAKMLNECEPELIKSDPE